MPIDGIIVDRSSPETYRLVCATIKPREAINSVHVIQATQGIFIWNPWLDSPFFFQVRSEDKGRQTDKAGKETERERARARALHHVVVLLA